MWTALPSADSYALSATSWGIGVSLGSPLPTTTVVDHVLSWFHTISFSGGWNYGSDPGPSDIASRTDCRNRAGMDARADERGAPDWGTVSPLGRAVSCGGVSAGLAQSGGAQKRLAIGGSQ